MAEPPPPSAPWTTPAPPPPPAWTPGPQKRHHRRSWIWLLVGAVAVILGLAVASGTVWITKVKPPIDAANDYLRDVTNGDYDAAFDQLCAAERVDSSPESLGRFFRGLFFTTSGYEVSPFDVHRDGNRVTVEADLNPDVSGGRGDVVRLRLEDTDGEWRPCGGRFGFVST
jgi:hypothetical protein